MIDKKTVARFKAHAANQGRAAVRNLSRAEFYDDKTAAMLEAKAREFAERAAHWANLWIKYSAQEVQR